MPLLTEAWATTYLQITIVLLVFAFGVPSLLFQITVAEDIRRIISRRRFISMYLYLIAAIVMAVVSLTYVWVFHPYHANNMPELSSVFANAIITASIVLTIMIWYLIFRYTTREAIIRRILNEIRNDYKKNNIITGHFIEDLIYLGENSDPGSEKDIVLSKVGELILHFQELSNYQGNELARLLNGIEMMLVQAEKKGSYNNFSKAISMLVSLYNNLWERELIESDDSTSIVRVLKKLTIAAIDQNYDFIALQILDTIQHNSEVLFNVGVISMKSQRFIISLSALNHLEAKTEEKEIAYKEDVDSKYLCGLLAHFFTSDYKSMKKRAESFLDRRGRFFESSLEECLNSAEEHYFLIAEYETADKLGKMKEELVVSK